MCLFVFSACKITSYENKQSVNNNEMNFAVVSDPHFQDVEGKFDSNIFTGIKDKNSNYTIRPMYEQMTSTRLFNENYYAFYQVLNDLVKQKVKYVVFTGDISDDGQAMNIKEIANIINKYETKYDMHFYLVPGNHEPQSPNAVDQGDDFLTETGAKIDVKSPLSDECKKGYANVVCDEQMASISQDEMVKLLGNFGYMPSTEDQMWATPYSSYEFADYTYEKALSESKMSNRTYQACNNDNCEDVSDLSYVVEPVEGYLFLCLDGDVYLPGDDNQFELEGDNGLNYFLKQRKETLKFIKKVTDYAKANHKHVIMFDHYPIADFYANNSKNLKTVFEEDGLDFDRLANSDIQKEIASFGIDLVFSGHMHYNATGVYQNDEDYLVNVMTGSTAAYVPSYKVISTNGNDKYEVDTKVLRDVKHFDKLFPYYKTEYLYESKLSDQKKEELAISNWNKDILNANNYYDFNRIFIETLVKTRHYPKWSSKLHEVFDNLNLYDLLIYSQVTTQMSPSKFIEQKATNQEIIEITNGVNKFLDEKEISPTSLKEIKGIDLVTMFYKFLSARELAYQDYSEQEIKAMSAAITYVTEKNYSDENKEYVKAALSIINTIYLLGNDNPSDHFIIDLNSKKITDLDDSLIKFTNKL